MPRGYCLSFMHNNAIKFIKIVYVLDNAILLIFLPQNKTIQIDNLIKIYNLGYFIFPIMLEPFKTD